jgi:heme/copper-type cytochrome/quinol oxidase subunit 3
MAHQLIPYTTEPRADTRVTNVTMGIWLFLSSEVMLFGALFSAYALLRVGAATWPSGRDVLDVAMGSANTVVLVLMTAAAWRARGRSAAGVRALLVASTGFALVFLGLKGLEYHDEISRGLVPAASTFLAMYFTLTGLHALHVIGGLAANLWILAGAGRVPEALTAGRVHAVTLYWAFVDVVWLVIFGLMYLS